MEDHGEPCSFPTAFTHSTKLSRYNIHSKAYIQGSEPCVYKGNWMPAWKGFILVIFRHIWSRKSLDTENLPILCRSDHGSHAKVQQLEETSWFRVGISGLCVTYDLLNNLCIFDLILSSDVNPNWGHPKLIVKSPGFLTFSKPSLQCEVSMKMKLSWHLDTVFICFEIEYSYTAHIVLEHCI